MNSSQIGNIGSSGTIGLNPNTIKTGPRHHRGNSDGNSQVRAAGHHQRKSSGSHMYLRTFEENIDQASALLTQTLELNEEGRINSRVNA